MAMVQVVDSLFIIRCNKWLHGDSKPHDQDFLQPFDFQEVMGDTKFCSNTKTVLMKG